MKTATTETYKDELRGTGMTHLGQLYRQRIVSKFFVGDSLLDVGAADGSMLRRLKPQFTRAVGVDPDPEFHSAEVFCAYAENLPFRDRTFTTVLCSAARKHFSDSRQAMWEMRRVLKPGGRVIVIDPNPWVVRLGMRLGKFDPRYVRRLDWAGEIGREMWLSHLTTIHKSNGVFVLCVGERQ